MTRPTPSGILAMLLLFGTAIAEALQLPSESRGAATPGQWVVVAAQALMVVSGTAAGLGVLKRRRWAPAVAAIWGASVTVAGSMATIAYGGAPWGAAATAAAACALVGVLVVWLSRRAIAARPPAALESR